MRPARRTHLLTKANSSVILSAAKDLSYLRVVYRICEVPRFARDDMAKAEGGVVRELHVFKFAQRMTAKHDDAKHLRLGRRRGHELGPLSRPPLEFSPPFRSYSSYASWWRPRIASR